MGHATNGAGVPALPQPDELVAPSDWQCIDLLSDLHLQAGLPRTFDAFRSHLLHTPAQAVLLLGDIFEVWVGDDAADEGFERECALVLQEAARSRWIGFMHGNRDFLVGTRFLTDCGLHALPDPTVLTFAGQRFLLAHGDSLCLDDTEYQRFRAQVRTEAWAAQFLAQPLAARRQIAAQLRAASEERKRTQGMESYGDVDGAAASSWLEAAGSKVLIHGHTHRPATHIMPAGAVRHVLSDWDLDGTHDTTARAEVLRLTRDGMQRLAPA